MKNNIIIAIDPSQWGQKTAGTGISVGVINEIDNITYEIEISNFAIMGVDSNNQTEYNNSVITKIKKIMENYSDTNFLIRIEEYVDYQKAATKYATNGVAEMIGAIKLTFSPTCDIIMRKAQVIKTRWSNTILKKMNFIDKNNKLLSTIVYKNNKINSIKNNNPYKTNHEFDAWRHLIDEICFGKLGVEKWKK